VCAACGQFHDADRPGSRPRFGAGAAPGFSPPPGGTAPPSPSAGIRTRSGDRPGGCIVLLLIVVLPIVVAIAAVGLAIRSGSDDASDAAVGATDLSPNSGDLLVLPGDLGADPSVVTLATRIGGDSERVVALVDLEDGPVWEAAVVPDDVYSAQLVATDDLVIAALGRHVVALDRADGSVAWEAEATDEVDPSCTDCLLVLDGTLVVLARDGEVVALDLASGEEIWAHVFTSVIGRMVPVGDAVLLVDDPPLDTPGAALSMVLVRPSDGEELSRFAPGCPDEVHRGAEYSISTSPSAPIIPIPDTDDVVLVYGSTSSCVQRWTVTSGEQRWSRTVEARLDWFDFEDRPWALGSTEVVLAGYEDWLVVGLAEGGIEVVPAPEGNLNDPRVAIVGDVFVGATSTTRGTAEWTLVAHDLRGGEERWARDLGPDAVPLVVAARSSSQTVVDLTGFALTTDGDALRLLTAGPPGPRFEVESIDPATGEGEVVGVAPVRTDSPMSVGVRLDTIRGDDVLVDADGVFHVIDLTTGAITVAWGR
jgi:outer membrane protein assembly factor BamB